MAKKKKEKEKEPEEGAEEGAAEAQAKPEGEEGAAEGEEGEGAPKKGKKKLIIIVAVVLMLVLGGVGFLLMGGDGKPKEHEKTEEELKAEAEANKPVYYELPEFLVNLSAPGGRVSFLKMSVTLELKDKASVAVVDANKPRVLDTFNTYLRELRPSDVQGSAGIYRLKDELMTRINGTVQEGLVKDILFSEIIVQ